MKAMAIAAVALFLWGCSKAPSDSKAAGGNSSASGGGSAAGSAPRQDIAGAEARDANAGVTFLGLSTQAATVVYLVDRSGSMLSSFDDVRREVLDSVARLDPKRQSFHVILFSSGPPMEIGEGKASLATEERKKAAAEFLEGAYAAGETNPAPALTRAFDVLDAAPAGGKAIFLLTDSDFPDNEEVLQLCRSRNAAKDVHIFTLVYAARANGGEATMRRIADENGGEYRFAQTED